MIVRLASEHDTPASSFGQDKGSTGSVPWPVTQGSEQ
jgi:hypothetical protein